MKKKCKDTIVQADTPEGQRAGDALIEATENQIRDNEPPETREALERLMAIGESRENAMRYIASAMSIEIFEMVKNKTQYDKQRFINNQKNLPELPYDYKFKF